MLLIVQQHPSAALNFASHLCQTVHTTHYTHTTPHYHMQYYTYIHTTTTTHYTHTHTHTHTHMHMHYPTTTTHTHTRQEEDWMAVLRALEKGVVEEQEEKANSHHHHRENSPDGVRAGEYCRVLREAAVRWEPERFMALLPACGNAAFFAPFVELCFRHHAALSLAHSLSAQANCFL